MKKKQCEVGKTQRIRRKETKRPHTFSNRLGLRERGEIVLHPEEVGTESD